MRHKRQTILGVDFLGNTIKGFLMPGFCFGVKRIVAFLAVVFVAVAMIVLPSFAVFSWESNVDVHASSLKDAPAKNTLPKDTLPKKLDIHHIPAGLSKKRLIPKDNPLTEKRVALGRRLFFDGKLSKDGSLSCASCHQPDHGFAAPDATAVGIRGQIGARNTPTIINRAYGHSMFWDGRAKSFEEQALGPIANPKELGTTVEAVIKTLKGDRSYVQQFAAAFRPSKETKKASAESFVTATNLAKALGGFQRTLLLGDSPVDRFRSGDYTALTTEERQGLWIFESKGLCWKCHKGADFTDEEFHNTGAGWGAKPVDLGRFDATKKFEDIGKFKTPTLRGLTLTGPYMHNGRQKTLQHVVEFYNKGGNPNVNLSSKMKPLKLSKKEVHQLVLFLKALSRTADKKSNLPDPKEAAVRRRRGLSN